MTERKMIGVEVTSEVVGAGPGADLAIYTDADGDIVRGQRTEVIALCERLLEAARNHPAPYIRIDTPWNLRDSAEILHVRGEVERLENDDEFAARLAREREIAQLRADLEQKRARLAELEAEND